MKRKFLYITLLVALTLIGSTAVSAQNRNFDSIEQTVRRQLNAQLAFDAAELVKITTTDYIEISPLGEFDPREKMFVFYDPKLKPAGLDVKAELNEVSVRVYGKFGIVIARIDYTMSNDGKALPPRSIRATFVVRQFGKEWKVSSAQFTGIKPTTPSK